MVGGKNCHAYAAAVTAGVRVFDTLSRTGAGDRTYCEGYLGGRACHIGHAGAAEQRGQRREQLPPHQRQLRPDALLSRQADQHLQRRQASSGLDLPDGGEGVAGDDADRRQRRDVRHDLVQSRLRAQRQDRRAVLALQAQDGSDHDLLLRPEQSRRRGLRRQGLHGDARRQARRARRQDRQPGLGDRRSPIRSSATAKRWRRPPSTARSSSARTAANTAFAASCEPTTPRPAS